MSAVQSLIERGVELKPPNSSEQPFSFPLHHAIKVVHLAESTFRHVEMNVLLDELQSFLLAHGFA